MRRENFPVANKIAVLIPDEAGDRYNYRDIILAYRFLNRNINLRFKKIYFNYPVYFALVYFLLFPNNNRGYYNLRILVG